MNQPTPGPLDDDEEELMRELVSEAGDPAVTPRPEFFARLRANDLQPPRSPPVDPAAGARADRLRLRRGPRSSWWS